ncbi:histone-lysine N-methyltransferase, H3 lysine-9 specific SUVH6-like [Gastrolobium bilobum]|uniref:histone-lysine N-methyltransferase, H3 lysine-9 specific SUVH6-like n=1 Tax=Gastrolobium bilobum TaxID=150636 RepID=UPI002AB2B730|nr:histone-lysine N-methyltransferase, H3 lysine-9 specific SUVH6-like [Gastrolobium bilobum]
METSVNNGHSNGDCNFLAQPMYKRRKVSAIRDFPEQCGPLASRIDPVLKVDSAGFGSANGTVVEDKNGEHLGGEAAGTSKYEDDSRHSEFEKDSFLTETLGQTIESSLKKESSVASSHHTDGPTLGNDEPAEVKLLDIEALDTTVNSVKCDSSYMSKSSSPVGEAALSSFSNSLSSDVNIDGSSAYLVEAVTRRYLPRRKVSVLRDFPPFCGRDAPSLSKDEPLKRISSLSNKRARQQDLAVDDNPLKKVAVTDVKEVEDNIQDECGSKGKFVDIVQADSEGNATGRVKKLDVFEPSSGIKLEKTKEKYIAHFEKSNRHQVEIKSKAVVKDEVQRPETKPLNVSSSKHELKRELKGLQISSDRKVVLGLMAKSECPLSSDKGSSKFKLIGGTDESKGKKVGVNARPDRSKVAIKTKDGLNHSGQKPLKKKKEDAASDGMGQLEIWEKKDSLHSEQKPLKKEKGNAASDGMGQLVIWEKKDSLDPNENIEDFQVARKSHGHHVTIPPHNFSGHDNDSNVTRNKVRETLRLYQAVSRKLLQEVEAKPKDRENTPKRIDLQAAKILKGKEKYINTGKQILGSVPGVEVGDEFQYRVELNIIGLHRQTQGGIDYVKHNGKILATSIVASGGYADELDNSDVLIYTGQGGNVMNTDKAPVDQKLERGNLALKNSSEEKNPVRVIRGYESMDGNGKTYVYDGLYLVDSCWQDMGPHGKLVYKFRLRRIPGQPELALKEVKKSKKFKTREGLCVDDISYGKERIPICAVNTIDDEKPPTFKYITSMIYPDCDLIPPEGCGCIDGCSDLKKCSCVVKNGGEIPFNHNGAIVEAKPLVYECGPSCKCPSTCYNRVSQLGIKFQLEIFKTNSRGWGVRSLNSIPSGSFICEYLGELLEEKEAEQRTGNDEYLFDIGNNFTNSTLWDGLSTLMPDTQSSSCEVVKEGSFTIDAAQFGNVGRFINHSCSPNLYAQNVLFDHHDNRIPHIMLFAAENIPPLQELSYDYNYTIDQVRDSSGNIKKKACYCGSVDCTGRMY